MAMIDLARTVINDLTYSNSESVNELLKLLRISKFIYKNIARGCSPPYAEALQAIEDLQEIENKVRTTTPSEQFNEVKNEVIGIMDKYEPFLQNINKLPSMDELFHGESVVTQMERIQFALLRVEQNNLDFFIERESHLPTQPYDRLFSHIMIYKDTSIQRISVHFMDEELPEHIKKQVLSAFIEAGENVQDKAKH